MLGTKLSRATKLILYLFPLSMINSLPDDISIYQIRHDQTRATILLEERWSMLQQVISKRDITIRSPILYVCGQKYAKVVGGRLVN